MARSALAVGAPVGGSLPLHELLDGRLAHSARLFRPLIDEKLLPKVSRRSLGVDVVPERSAADFDGLGEHLLDGLREGLRLRTADAPRGAARRNLCTK